MTRCESAHNKGDLARRSDMIAKRNCNNASSISAFANVVKCKGELAKKTLEKTAESACTLDSIKEALSEETQLVVDMSNAAKKAYKDGLIKLDVDKAGNMFAQLRDGNGRYGKKIPIKEQVIANGLNPLEVQNAMRTQAIQEQLEEIVATLAEINECVGDIKQGQRDDRLGLFLSGQTLYLESREISDPFMRKFLEAQALKSLSDANGQLSQSITTDIRYLTEERYKAKKTGQRRAIEERISSIRSSLDAVNMSYALKAAIYYSDGETDAMLRCLEQYADFIGRSIAPNSKKLAELDSTEKLPKGGFWEEKTLALEAVKRIRAFLCERVDSIEVPSLKPGEGTEDAER